MPLKLRLKPQEKIVIDRAVIINGDTASTIFIENKVPILREKDLLKITDVQSPCQHVYLSIQLMYLEPERLEAHHKSYWKWVKAIIEASPSTLDHISKISKMVSEEDYYLALKKTKTLIKYESELIQRACS